MTSNSEFQARLGAHNRRAGLRRVREWMLERTRSTDELEEALEKVRKRVARTLIGGDPLRAATLAGMQDGIEEELGRRRNGDN